MVDETWAQPVFLEQSVSVMDSNIDGALLLMLRLRPLVVGVWLLQQDSKAKGTTGCTLLVRADHHDETN